MSDKIGDQVTDVNGITWQVVDKFQRRQTLGWFVNKEMFNLERVRKSVKEGGYGFSPWVVEEETRRAKKKTKEEYYDLCIQKGTGYYGVLCRVDELDEEENEFGLVTP